MKNPLACITVLLALFGAGVLVAGDAPEARTARDTDLDTLASWMTGSFASTAQAGADESYFDIRLHMAPIWTERSDAVWLYVEQAVATDLKKPYRQRVYRIRRIDDNLFESMVFTMPDPAKHVGAWKTGTPLAELGPHDLTARDGCALLLRRIGDSFAGGTLGSICTSTLRGATYATSEAVITAQGMVSWDRGFDADNTQVWGATEGGYIFDRVEKQH